MFLSNVCMSNHGNKRAMFLRCFVAACIALGSLVYGAGCRSEGEDAKEKIEKIEFDKERVTVKIDEETTVKVIAKSDEAKKNEKIEYTSVNEGIIEIREMSNDGFIVKGLRGGSTVITAKSKQVTSYLEVIVEGEAINANYIMIAQPVMEMLEGERKSTQVSLYGGSVLDNNDFVWKLENGKNNIRIDVTQNLAVVSGLSRGYQKIIVEHPKAEFTSEILVFVKGVDEEIKYISGISNVVLMPNDGQYHDFAVTLFNGRQEDIINFVYTITEGGDSIRIEPNANVCNVMGVKAGTSVIKVTHPQAVNEFDVRLIIYDVNIPYIVLDQTFLLMSIGEGVNVKATIENPKNEALALNEFSYEVADNSDVVELVQTGNFFYVRARKGGYARIIISNNQAQTPRELLVVIRNEIVYRDDYYITTSQNVILTQVGADEVQLNMQLVNGNNADANSFEWVVDDGTIITVESPHGIVRGNRAVINSVFNAVAVITAKKAGTAKITVSHPKSEVNAVVMVKVYPKGTFAETPILVGTDGLLKAIKGTPETVQLKMVSGDVSNVGSLDWVITDTKIAAVNTSAHGMVNVLNGLDNGLTKLVVSGNNLQNSHESLVLAGTPDYVSNASVIYVDSVYQTMVTEQTVRIEVKDSQGIYSGSNDFNAIVEDKNLLYAVMVKNQLVLQGKDVGETKVRISHPYAMNDITVNVRIDPAHITIDKPYYISGPEIVGLVRGRAANLSVALAGAGVSEEGALVWTVDDANIVGIIANGKDAIVTGRVSNRQTKVTVSHKKSENDKVIILYVVENEEDLKNKVALGLKDDHYLLKSGEEILITLITSANETQKLGIQWMVESDESAITVDPHYDSAMVRAVRAGNAKVTITHPDNILPQIVYVSVVDALSGEKVIKGPAVIELVKGESKIVAVNHLNLDQTDTSNIRWDIEDRSIASIQENGDSAYMLGVERGITYVNITQNQIGYKHRATLLCANPGETLYVMGVDQSYHMMTVGEEKKIRLVFGSNGFPESAKTRIKWTAGAEGVVRVAGSGESATIAALEKGIGKVTVSSDDSFNSTLELMFDIRGGGSYEMRGYDKIIGIVVGDTKQTTIRLYNGNDEVANGYSLLQYENENDNIIGINPIDNIIDITARSAGQSYITVRHTQTNEPARILVYTANTQEELDKYYPIAADKINYLLQVGEQVTVRINTIESKDAGNLSKVIWGLENASIIDMPQSNGKKEAVIKGRAAGQCVITINYEGKTVERIYVSVVENNAIDMSKYIVTENIIGMLKGESRNTTIYSNLGAGELNTVVWESSDPAVVTVSGSGANAVITARNPAGSAGEAYVTVTYGSWLKRHILVYLCDTEEQVKNYKAMNMENQYIRLGKNENITLPLYYAPVKSTVPTLWVDKYDNKVVRFNAVENGGKLEITSLNEGVAALEAVNTGLSNPGRILRIYIEVSNQYTNMPHIPELKYLTTAKTIYLLNPDEKEVYADLSVNGIGLDPDELNNVNWRITNGSQYASIYPNGKNCRVRVNQFGLEGSTDIEAYSYVDNPVKIKVIVSRSGLLGFPHIAGEDIIRVGLKDKRMIEYNVAEIVTYQKDLFTVKIKNGAAIVDAKMVGNILEVEGKVSGQALLEITHNECQFAKEVVIIVTSTPDGLIYLTTGNNFSVVKVNEYKLLTVDMIGYDNAGNQGYTWTVDDAHKSYISLSGSGRQAQVSGLAAGSGKTAKVTVSNTIVDPLYNLSMYVRVSDLEINPVYITTTKNIVTVKEGQSAYIQAELVNGRPEDNNLFAYTSLNKTAADAEGAGTQGIIIGKTLGTARIKISNSTAVNTGLEILVIVEKDTTSSGIYITGANSVIDLKPGGVRQVSVQLIGGNPQDIYGFQWEIKTQNPYIAGKAPVIRLDYTADGAFITGVNEGEAAVQVTHPKTNYVFEIKVYVQEYGQLQFKQKSVSVYEGDTVMVGVECPTRYLVQYRASPADKVKVSGTKSMCSITGLKEGVCIVTVSNIEGTASDEILVEVKKKDNRIVRYIQTPEVIYNMTDWRSAKNRLIIAGTTVGEKNDGRAFTDLDDNNLRWKIVEGKEVIGFGYDDIEDDRAKRTEENGRSVNIFSIRAGTAKIAVSHSEMDSDYKKELYVYVHAHDASFSLDPTYLMMQVGEMLPVTAVLGGNLPELDFSLISWETADNENGIKGIKLVENNNDYDTMTGRQSVWVKAVAEGVCKLKSTFNNATTLECSVYVEKEKYLRLGIEGYQMLLPGQDLSIPISVSPADSVVTFQTDYLDYLGYLEGKDYKIEIVPLTGTIERVVNVRGGDREGITNLKLTANGIERMISLNTNYNFAFNLHDPKALRLKPDETKSIGYDVFPKGDQVTFLSGGQQGDSESIGGGVIAPNVAADISVDSANQTVTVKGLRAGYTVMRYESDYNKRNQLVLKVPVYVYYDKKVDIKWNISKPTSGKMYSSFDPYTNVIRIADGEQIYLDMEHGMVKKEKYIKGYPGLFYTFDTDSNSENGEVNSDESNNELNNTIRLLVPYGPDGKKIKSTNGTAYIVASEYKGTVTVKYEYYDGGESQTQFTRTFIVYHETWARP